MTIPNFLWNLIGIELWEKGQGNNIHLKKLKSKFLAELTVT
jgi:hypothetical protein